MKVDPVSVLQPAAAAPGAAAPLSSEAVTREIGVRRWHLGFGPAVEARFEQDTARLRRRDLLVAGLLSLVMYDLFLVSDHLLRPADFANALFWRGGVMTLYGAVVLALIARGVRAGWREWSMASTIVVAALASGAIFAASDSPASHYDPFVFGLLFVAGNVAFPLRFVQAIAASLSGVAVTAAFVVPAPHLPLDAKVPALAMIAGGAIFTLIAAYRVEASMRQAYLLVLRESLRTQEATQVADELALLSNTDPLTQVGNRRSFDAALARAWLAAGTRGSTVAMLLIDVDHFKAYNDRFGHPRGDTCLRDLAAAMRCEVRGGDLLARVGGEEFAVLLPGASLGRAHQLAERLRHGVAALELEHDGLDGRRHVSVSVGVAVRAPAAGAPSSALMEAADRALYRAKREGRNRVMVEA